MVGVVPEIEKFAPVSVPVSTIGGSPISGFGVVPVIIPPFAAKVMVVAAKVAGSPPQVPVFGFATIEYSPSMLTEPTVIVAVSDPVRPWSSVTVRVTEKADSTLYVCGAFTPVAIAPSPKFHWYSTIVPRDAKDKSGTYSFN